MAKSEEPSWRHAAGVPLFEARSSSPVAPSRGLVVKDRMSCLIWVRIPLESGFQGGGDPRAKAGRPYEGASRVHYLPQPTADTEAGPSGGKE